MESTQLQRSSNDVWCLPEAIQKVCESRGAAHLIESFTLVGLQVQLAGKWKHAADAYRDAHPDELPAEKLYDGHHRTHLLPRAVAEEKLAVWIPWAIQHIQAGLTALVAQYGTLTPSQAQAVEVEPVLDDEVV